jgi:hypothetical protein
MALESPPDQRFEIFINAQKDKNGREKDRQGSAGMAYLSDIQIVGRKLTLLAPSASPRVLGGCTAGRGNEFLSSEKPMRSQDSTEFNEYTADYLGLKAQQPPFPYGYRILDCILSGRTSRSIDFFYLPPGKSIWTSSFSCCTCFLLLIIISLTLVIRQEDPGFRRDRSA